MFERELKKFKEIQDHLKAENPNGGFVVINGEEVLGIWNDRLDALKQGIEKYGNVPFLVRDIKDEDIAINFSRNIQFA